MNSKHLLLLSGLLCANAASNAATYDAHNVEASDLISGIYSVTVNQTGATPVIHVKSDGSTYTDVLPNQSITWQASTRGVCRGLWNIYRYKWWLNDNTQQNPHSYYQHHVKLAEKNWITSNHHSGKYEAAGMLGMPVNSALANHAVQACNNRLQSEMGKGKTAQEVLSKEQIINSNELGNPKVAGVVYLQCGGDQGLNTNLAHAWQNVRVNYVCDAHQFPTPKPAGVMKFDAPFALETPKLGVTPSPYTGSCPVDLTAEGTLKANKGLQDVKYRWSHNGALGPVATIKLNSNGWKTVNTVLKDIGKPSGGKGQLQINQQPKQQGMQFQANPSNVHNGYVELKVLPASKHDWNKAKTKKVPYSVNCKEIGQAKFVAPKPTEKSDLVPGPTLTVANATGPWGSTLEVDATAHTNGKRGDRCPLRFAYDVINQGQSGADNFYSLLFENATTLDQKQINQLLAGKNRKVSGVIYLNDGTHLVGVWADNKQNEAESNETNNKARITVNVKNCSGPNPTPPRPSTPPRSMPQRPQ